MGKWFGKGKFLGISKLDLEIMEHRTKHGKMLNPEILAHCPICNKDHKVMFFQCKCGDPFFAHLNNMSDKLEVGKIHIKGSPIFEDT